MSVVKINETVQESLAGVLVETLQVSKNSADAIVNDRSISGTEIWQSYSKLGRLIAHCDETEPQCWMAFPRQFFTETLHERLVDAASLKGNDKVIDDALEVSAIERDFTDLIAKQEGALTEDKSTFLEEHYDDLGADIVSAREHLEHWGLRDQEVDRIMSSVLPKGMRIHTLNPGSPTSVVVLAYVPTSQEIPVTISSLYDFLMGHLENYPEYTQQYKKQDLYFGQWFQPGQKEGVNITDVELDISGIRNPIYHSRNIFLMREDGENTGAFATRFTLVPGSGQNRIEALEAVLVARPVTEGGVLVEFWMDFDLTGIPYWVLNWVNDNAFKTLVDELVKGYALEVKTGLFKKN